MNLEVKEIEIRVLRPNNGEVEGLPRNPRKISKKQLEKLKKSLADAPEMLRLRELICVEHPDGPVVIAGNQRLEAAKALGWETLPCKVLPADTDPAKLREYAIKDNLPFGEDDWEVIASDWDQSELEEWGMEVPDKWKSDTTAEEDDFDPDSVKDTVCKKGDIWQLGDHRLMCGDSTDAGSVALLMDGKKADLLLTDPPYNVAYIGKTKDALTIENDRKSDKDYLHMLEQAFSNAGNSLEKGAAFYIWTAQGHAMTDNMKALDKAELIFRQQLIWVKNTLVLGHMDYHEKHEPCLYGWTEGAHKFYADRTETTVIDDTINVYKLKKEEMRELLRKILDDGIPTTIIKEKRPTCSDLHPTMKPVKLMGRLMQNSSKKGDIILDLFGGSGTTLIAAEQLGRKCYMMELDPHYCDVIIARWEKLTGKKATKIN